MGESVLVEVIDRGIVTLTLNRPETLNALTGPLIEELLRTLDEIEHDADVRVLILTGSGRGFCSGLDLNASLVPPGTEAMGPVQQQLIGQRRWWARLVPRFRTLPQPIIAAVNGPAVGGGFVLALASDIRLASPSAMFADGFLKMGVSGCELGLSWLLPRVVGEGRASHMLLTGRRVGAEEALRYGLVADIVAEESLLDASIELARDIASNSPLGIMTTKEVLWASLQAPFEVALQMESRAQVLALQTDDCREQLRARFKGEAPSYRMT
jgi:enoyl-CoA hydratase